MESSRFPSLTRMAVAIALPAVAIALWPGVASAHPFGPPPRSWLDVDGTTVMLSWEAAYDDYLALGEELGYFEPGTTTAYLDPSVQVAPARSDEEAFAASDELGTYLADNLVVEHDGRRCELEAVHHDAILERGAVVVHECPEPPGELTLRITMLQDLNDAYRTFGLAEEGPPGPFAIFTVEEPTHRVDVAELVGDSGAQGRLVLFGAVAVLAVGVPTAFRRLTRGDGR